MGQKVNPTGYRLGNFFSWRSRWFAPRKSYQDMVFEDFTIREHLKKALANAGLVRSEIERSIALLRVIVVVSRPGVVIGKGGENLKTVAQSLEAIVNKGKKKQDLVKVDLKVEEERKPDLSAKLVAERIVDQIIKRYPHRRAVTQAIEKVMQAGAQGVKISLSGRIGGAEIGRTENYSEGKVPTQTLRANIDYYQVPARTRSGYVGVKVWIYKGMITG